MQELLQYHVLKKENLDGLVTRLAKLQPLAAPVGRGDGNFAFAPVRDAQRARGLDPDTGSLAARLRKNVPLLVPTFLTTIRMTGPLAMSLEAKGFALHRKRTSLLEARFGAWDAAVLALLVVALAGALLTR